MTTMATKHVVEYSFLLYVRICNRNIWFAEGTFSVTPQNFFQLFAVLRAITERNRIIGLPFAHALLQNKRQGTYTEVFSVLSEDIRALGIAFTLPATIMTDFELPIINSANNIFKEDKICRCFFHLCQSIYRHFQSEGLPV